MMLPTLSPYHNHNNNNDNKNNSNQDIHRPVNVVTITNLKVYLLCKHTCILKTVITVHCTSSF